MRLPGPTFIVREPARLSLRIWERGLSGALTLVRIGRELLDPPEESAMHAAERARGSGRGNGGPPAAERPAPRRSPARSARTKPAEASGPTPADAPSRPEAAGPPSRPKPAEPPSRPESAHLDTEPELVAEVAEAGAEDGAGAELHIDEPWDGYDAMSAPEVSRRLAREGEAAAAAVKLYEAAGKGRSSVLQAADRELAR